MSVDWRLQRLAIAHGALGLLAGVTASIEIRTTFGLRHLPIVPLFALTFAQVVLLATWAVFSSVAIWKRLVGSVVGLACLEAIFDLVLHGEFVGMPTLAMTVISGTLLALRRFGVRLREQDAPAGPPSPDAWRPRFSIRGLMVLTAVVALLSAAVRALKDSPGPMSLGLMVIWSLCFVAVGFMALRAALGRADPAPGCVIIFALSPVLGACFAYAANAHQDGWVYVILIMLLYPATLLASLGVLRSCGLRIVRA